MYESDMSRVAGPSWPLLSASIAPLFGVALSLATLWIAAIPSPAHSVVLLLDGCCYSKRVDEVEPHRVIVNSEGNVLWDGQLLPDRASMEVRLRAVGALPLGLQPAVIVDADRKASYGSYIAVLAAAQRNGVQKIGLIGEFRKEVIMTIPPSYWPID